MRNCLKDHLPQQFQTAYMKFPWECKGKTEKESKFTWGLPSKL